ncbi:MAG: hypothetical protein U0Q18_28175 [Bryobacteraceae bacterium]
MSKISVLVIASALVFASVAAGQYARRSRGSSMATATTGPYNGPAVTFHGTLKSVTKKEILLELDAVEQNEDQSLTLRRSGKTKFFKNEQEVKASDIPLGTKVTLDATRDGDMKLSALRVAVSPSPQPAK